MSQTTSTSRGRGGGLISKNKNTGKKNSGQRCIIKDCSHTSRKCTLHRFPPKDSEIFRLWKESVEIVNKCKWNSSVVTPLLCMCHFSSEHYRREHVKFDNEDFPVEGVPEELQAAQMEHNLTLRLKDSALPFTESSAESVGCMTRYQHRQQWQSRPPPLQPRPAQAQQSGFYLAEVAMASLTSTNESVSFPLETQPPALQPRPGLEPRHSIREPIVQIKEEGVEVEVESEDAVVPLKDRCRICASPAAGLPGTLHIFKQQEIATDLRNIINHLLPIEVKKDDQLPLLVCVSCCSVLTASSALMDTCLRGNIVLRTLLDIPSKKKSQCKTVVNSPITKTNSQVSNLNERAIPSSVPAAPNSDPLHHTASLEPQSSTVVQPHSSTPNIPSNRVVSSIPLVSLQPGFLVISNPASSAVPPEKATPSQQGNAEPPKETTHTTSDSAASPNLLVSSNPPNSAPLSYAYLPGSNVASKVSTQRRLAKTKKTPRQKNYRPIIPRGPLLITAPFPPPVTTPFILNPPLGFNILPTTSVLPASSLPCNLPASNLPCSSSQEQEGMSDQDERKPIVPQSSELPSTATVTAPQDTSSSVKTEPPEPSRKRKKKKKEKKEKKKKEIQAKKKPVIQRSRAMAPNTPPPDCEICCKHFLTHGAHMMHMRFTHNIFLCLSCPDFKGTTVEDLHKHTQDKSQCKSLTKLFACTVCGKLFNGRPQLQWHMNRHEGKKEYPCLVCGKGFYSPAGLKIHSEHHEPPKYQCAECPRIFANKKNLNFHIDTVHRKMWNFSCNLCVFQCGSIEEMTQHLDVSHPVECLPELPLNLYYKKSSPFKCEHCPKYFASRLRLHSHLRLVHEIRGKNSSSCRFMCDICGKVLKSAFAFKIHSNHHLGIKDFQCEICNKCFTTKASLVLHGRLHRGEMPYKCDSCPKRFHSKSLLKLHMRKHVDIKLYECQFCSKTYKYKRHLTSHEQLHKEGVKLFTTKCRNVRRVKAEHPLEFVCEIEISSP